MAASSFSLQTAPLVINGQPIAGGFNLNYQIGPSTSAIASTAYSFLQNNINNAQGFVGQTIAGSQSFLNSQVSPFVQAVQNQAAQNVQQQPTLTQDILAFGNSQLQYAQMMQQNALAAQQATAQASIASSNASASAGKGGGGGCFITTAICEHENLPDDCLDLTKLRLFRDDYMLSKPETAIMVQEYYDIAPKIVVALESRQDKAKIYKLIRREYIDKCLLYIDEGMFKECLYCYRSMIIYCRQLTGI
jgi:hypothetical protein